MILGRHPNLWLGAATALWNVFILALPGLTGATISPELSNAVNIALGTIILLVANSNDLSISAGRVALKQEQDKGNTTSAPKP